MGMDIGMGTEKGCLKEIKNSYYTDYRYQDGECDYHDVLRNDKRLGINKCCLQGLFDYSNNINETLRRCYVHNGGGGGDDGSEGDDTYGFYMYNCNKVTIVDIEGTETNKKIFIGSIGLLVFLLFITIILLYHFYFNNFKCRGFRTKLNKCFGCFDYFRRKRKEIIY